MGKNFLKILIPAVLFLLFFVSCTRVHNVSVVCSHEQKPLFEIPGNSELPIFLHVYGGSNREWYRLYKNVWLLNEPADDLVYKAMAGELEQMGITVVKSLDKSEGRLDVEIRWFAPYGYTGISATVILSLTLYKGMDVIPLWKDKIDHGEYLETAGMNAEEKNAAMGETVSKALRSAVSKLSFEAGFTSSLMEIID